MTVRSPGVDVGALAMTVLERLPEETPPERLDDVLQLLADRRRRLTLAVLRRHGESLSLPDVADEVAVHERGRPLPEISPQTVTEIYTSIYHDHLPRLVEAGLVSYDQERDLVEPTF